MENLIKALWEIRQHLIALCEMFNLEQWPTHPGYDNLIKGIAATVGIDEDQFWIWFENHCESLEQLKQYIAEKKVV